MRIPEIRTRLEAMRDELDTLIKEMHRRKPLKKAPTTSAKLTTSLKERLNILRRYIPPGHKWQ